MDNDNDQKISDINLKRKIYPLSQCNIKMQIYDLRSKNDQTVSTLLSTVINEARIVIFAFDLMKKESLNSIKTWYNETRKLNAKFMPILAGNKYDLFKNMNDLYKIEIIKLARDYSKQMHCPFIMTSAKSSIHIQSLFTLIIEYMVEKKFTLKQQKERHGPIIEWNDYYPYSLRPTVHLKKLMEIHEQYIKRKELNDMIESDIDESENEDMVYPQEHIYHSGDNFDDDDDVKEVKVFLDKTQKEIRNEILMQGIDADDDNEDNEEGKFELRKGVNLMEKGTVTKSDDDHEDDDKGGVNRNVRFRSKSLDLSRSRERSRNMYEFKSRKRMKRDDGISEKERVKHQASDDDEEEVKIQKFETLMGFAKCMENECDDDDDDDIIIHKSMTLMGGNLTMEDENESDDEKVIESDNVTMIGLCENNKLKFIK